MTSGRADAKPPRSGRSADRRARALAAAVDLLLKQGFDNTSMDAVAERAGISKTTLYAHFQDKVGLFHAAFGELAAALDFQLDQTVLGCASADEKLTAVATELLRETTSPSFQAFLRTIVSESTRRPELVPVRDARGVPHAVDVLAGILRQDAAERGYTLDNPRAQATLFLRMAAACMQLDALCDLRFRPGSDLLSRHAQWVTEFFLRALRSPDAVGEHRAPPVPDGYDYPWTLGVITVVGG
jgi:TetR/AcrR family transcriptional regulator, mexJK operon transcriptional repressor